MSQRNKRLLLVVIYFASIFIFAGMYHHKANEFQHTNVTIGESEKRNTLREDFKTALQRDIRRRFNDEFFADNNKQTTEKPLKIASGTDWTIRTLVHNAEDKQIAFAASTTLSTGESTTDEYHNVHAIWIIDLPDGSINYDPNNAIQVSREIRDTMEAHSITLDSDTIEKAKAWCYFRAEPGFWSMVYLSTATITTLGFGDIVPISDCCRILVSFESIFGLILMGFLIHVVVSPETAERSDCQVLGRIKHRPQSHAWRATLLRRLQNS